MTTAKDLGIWMDHSSAHLTEFTTEPMVTTVIDSAFSHEAKEQSLSKGENVMHNKQQHQQADFYKKLGNEIKKYDRVILFGPTDAKTELFNVLQEDKSFEKIKIKVLSSDKLTGNQEHAFVREHFSKQ